MTQHSTSLYRNTVLLVIVLAMAGCKSACDKVEQPSATPTAIQLVGTGDSYVEMSAAAAAPTGTGPCKDGMILVAAGNGTQQLLMGSLQAPPASYDLAGWDGTTWAKRGTGPLDPPPTGSTEAPGGSDNQAASLANGDLLVTWNGSTKAPLTGIPGFRAAQVIWRYSCAQGKWLSTSILDSGVASALDANGTPQPGYCSQAAPGVGGFDRPELYADPFGVGANGNQRIFFSVRCARTDDDSAQVFVSPDAGTSWNASGIRLGPGTPIAMTSTSNGRLLMLQPSGTLPVIHWSDDNGASLASPAGGYDVTYRTADPKPGGEPAEHPMAQLSGATTGVGESQAWSLSLARTGNNAALAVYPSIEMVSVNGKIITRQIACVVWVLTKGKDQEPLVLPLKVIRSQAPDGSVLLPAFIQDDRPNAGVRTSMLYWLETASRPESDSEPVKMLARYVVFQGIIPDTEKVLSDAAGWEMNNRTRYKAIGDYMKGSFYAVNDTLNFVAIWPQVPPTVVAKNKTQVYARIITMGSPSGTPPAEGTSGLKPAPHAPVSPGNKASVCPTCPKGQGKP